MNGKVFSADVYSVLVAFGVQCPARQHAIKKLLMPGQRGSKSELQDLQEAIVSVSRAASMARTRLPEGGTLTGDTGTRSGDTLQPLLDRLAETGEIEAEPEPMAEPEPEPKPKMVTWRKCVRIRLEETANDWIVTKWWPSGDIPEDWYPIESYTQPIETVKQFVEGQRP